MKPEARVLVSRCTKELCVALVVRGRGFDGFIAASGCEELCKRLKDKGYSYEVRYSVGDCTCDYPHPPKRASAYDELLKFLSRVARQISSFNAAP